jgi:hypothetical protein
VGVGAVVGVLQGVGVGVAGPRALPATQLKAAQQLPPSGLLQRHLLSEQGSSNRIKIQTSAETSMDERQNIHTETSVVRKEKYSCRDIYCQNKESSYRIRIQKAEVETSVDIRQNMQRHKDKDIYGYKAEHSCRDIYC